FLFSITHQCLHSFPTRRSSDLMYDAAYPHLAEDDWAGSANALVDAALGTGGTAVPGWQGQVVSQWLPAAVFGLIPAAGPGRSLRSEEHTSELQSRFDLVCRLLL